MLDNVQVKVALADKGYDSNRILAKVQGFGATALIPATASRKAQREYDYQIYKQRNWLEQAFNRLKYYRLLPDTTGKRYTTLHSCIWRLHCAGAKS